MMMNQMTHRLAYLSQTTLLLTLKSPQKLTTTRLATRECPTNRRPLKVLFIINQKGEEGCHLLLTNGLDMGSSLLLVYSVFFYVIMLTY